jgi:inorganic pyrophosphatase/solute carrier family 25 iron transporter 28/37
MAARTVAVEGVRGLYGGYGVVLVGSGPASALYFGGYKLVGRYLGEHRPEAPFPNAIAGFSAEVLALTVYTPMDVTKQRLQVAPAGTTVGMMLTTLTRERGVRGLWSGYWAGLMVCTLQSSSGCMKRSKRGCCLLRARPR